MQRRNESPGTEIRGTLAAEPCGQGSFSALSRLSWSALTCHESLDIDVKCHGSPRMFWNAMLPANATLNHCEIPSDSEALKQKHSHYESGYPCPCSAPAPREMRSAGLASPAPSIPSISIPTKHKNNSNPLQLRAANSCAIVCMGHSGQVRMEALRTAISP